MAQYTPHNEEAADGDDEPKHSNIVCCVDTQKIPSASSEDGTPFIRQTRLILTDLRRAWIGCCLVINSCSDACNTMSLFICMKEVFFLHFFLTHIINTYSLVSRDEKVHSFQIFRVFMVVH